MKQPLVSIAVITYNSAVTVIETLDSILSQTYLNLELIISDDCSTDNTVTICRKWLDNNAARFVRTVLIESPVNTGISANCNRAEDACNGGWEKLLAGDDLLLPECVETYMKFVVERKNIPCVFSRALCFSAIDGKDINNDTLFDYSFFSLSREKQLERLLYKSNCVPAATVFFNLALMRRLGIRNDERIPLLEDLPRWINILNSGYRLEFLDRKLVKYRVFDGVSTNEASPGYYYSGLLYTLLYQYPEWQKRDPDNAFRLLRIWMGSKKPDLGVRDRRNLRVGRFILGPIYYVKDLVCRKKDYIK